MPQACWQAAADGTYWLDVAVGSLELSLLIDTRFVDAGQRVGCSLEPNFYDQLRQAGEFAHFFTDFRLDAAGRITARENGLIVAQLICPLTRQRIGPTVRLYVSRGSRGVPNRVGLPFFHHLQGCRVWWDLGQRKWCVEYP